MAYAPLTDSRLLLFHKPTPFLFSFLYDTTLSNEAYILER